MKVAPMWRMCCNIFKLHPRSQDTSPVPGYSQSHGSSSCEHHWSNLIGCASILLSAGSSSAKKSPVIIARSELCSLPTESPCLCSQLLTLGQVSFSAFVNHPDFWVLALRLVLLGCAPPLVLSGWQSWPYHVGVTIWWWTQKTDTEDGGKHQHVSTKIWPF